MKAICYDCGEIIEVQEGLCPICKGEDLEELSACPLCGGLHHDDGILCRGCETKVVEVLNEAIEKARGTRALELSRSEVIEILREELERL